MDIDTVMLAVTVFFHFIFIPIGLGLAMLVAIMETIYVRTKNEQY